ncbi:MAG: hypothetical protein DRJ43_04380 [Thermoprotei archaeon]|nr:MAG: hypothetical protein DRJ43_04380 [Thermoprotei archaeon]
MVRVNSVARSGAVLAVYVDDSLALKEKLPDLDGRSEAFAGEYGLEVVVKVPPGTHTIKLDNLGDDWLTMDYVRLEGVVVRQAKTRILGLTNGTFAIVWIQNRDSTWWNAVHGIAVEPIGDLRIALYGLEDGDYLVEFWDPYRGAVIAEERCRAMGGRLVVSVKLLQRDLAVKAYRLGP